MRPAIISAFFCGVRLSSIPHITKKTIQTHINRFVDAGLVKVRYEKSQGYFDKKFFSLNLKSRSYITKPLRAEFLSFLSNSDLSSFLNDCFIFYSYSIELLKKILKFSISLIKSLNRGIDENQILEKRSEDPLFFKDRIMTAALVIREEDFYEYYKKYQIFRNEWEKYMVKKYGPLYSERNEDYQFLLYFLHLPIEKIFKNMK